MPSRIFSTWCVLLGVTSTVASGAMRQWTGNAGNNLWTDAGNWSGGIVPTDADTAVVPFTTTIDLGGARVVSRIDIAGDVQLTGGTLQTAWIAQATGVLVFGNERLTATVLPSAGTLRINGVIAGGSLLGSNYQVITFGAVFEGPVTADLPLETLAVTLRDAGTLSAVPELVLQSGNTLLDNASVAVSGRLNPNSLLTHSSPSPASFHLRGNASSAVAEEVGALALQLGRTTIQISSPGSDTRLNAKDLTIAPSALLAVVDAGNAQARFTMTNLPQLLGGSTSIERPIVPLAQSAADLTDRATGFLTYDATVNGGSAVGFRSLRPEEFADNFASGAARANVRLTAGASLASAQTVNTLSIQGAQTLNLGSNDLHLYAGSVFADPGANAAATMTGGRLIATRPIHAIAGSGRLVIDSTIAASSLVVSGGSEVALRRSNTLPQGIVVHDGTSLSVEAPGALGTGTLTLLHDAALRSTIDYTHPGGLNIRNRTELASLPGVANQQNTPMLLGAATTFTITGGVTGTGRISNGPGGLLHLAGGGAFQGSLVSTQTSPTSGGGIWIDGIWSTPVGGSGLTARGGVFYGNADAPDLVIDGARLEPGAPDEIGTLRIGSLTSSTFIERSTFAIDIGADSADLLRVVRFTNVIAPDLVLNILNTPTIGTEFLIVDSQFTLSRFLRFNGLDEGAYIDAGTTRFQLSYRGGDGNDTTLRVVPEPTSLSLLAFVCTAMRRRRSP